VSTLAVPTPADLWGASGRLAVPRHQRRWVLARPRLAYVWVTVGEAQGLVGKPWSRSRTRGNAAGPSSELLPHQGLSELAPRGRESDGGPMLFTEGR